MAYPYSLALHVLLLIYARIMQYRRNHLAGASYFFTVNLAERDKSYLSDYADSLKRAVQSVQQKHPFNIDAMVVLPDHLHAIWTMPENDGDYSMRWRMIKSMFSRSLPNDERISVSRLAKGERGIWQRRYWEHQIRDELDFQRHVDYIHINPVKHGHVQHVKDWPHSSFHRYVREGLLPDNWAGDDVNESMRAGERSSDL